jgi:hypothetical protein
MQRGLRGKDIEAKLAGRVVTSFRSADEVCLHIRGSKTDVYNRGEARNHFRIPVGSEQAWICVVADLAEMQHHFPERFGGGKEELQWLLRTPGGRPLQRAEVQGYLRRAAQAVGEDPSTIGSHSLRFRGASALWAAFRDSGLVRRFGRWASETFHQYLWDARSNSAGLAEGMAKADLTAWYTS